MNYYWLARYSYSCYSMLFLDEPQFHNIIYNYLYISKLYIISENQRPLNEIELITTVTVTCSAPLPGHRVPYKVRYTRRGQIARR